MPMRSGWEALGRVEAGSMRQHPSIRARWAATEAVERISDRTITRASSQGETKLRRGSTRDDGKSWKVRRGARRVARTMKRGALRGRVFARREVICRRDANARLEWRGHL